MTECPHLFHIHWIKREIGEVAIQRCVRHLTHCNGNGIKNTAVSLTFEKHYIDPSTLTLLSAGRHFRGYIFLVMLWCKVRMIFLTVSISIFLFSFHHIYNIIQHIKEFRFTHEYRLPWNTEEYTEKIVYQTNLVLGNFVNIS